MTPRVATVLSAREWEARLVAYARESASLRLVLRAYRPTDLDARRHDLDTVVAGAETSWVTPSRIEAWKRSGLRVVGIHPVGDTPARDRLARAGSDEVLSDDAPAEAIARVIRLLDPPAPAQRGVGAITGITGPRGAPGRTEIAVALALARSRRGSSLLVDYDLDAPAIAIRLGVAPRPDVVDAADTVHAKGTIDETAIRTWHGIAAIVASIRSDEPEVRPELLDDLLSAASGQFDHVTVDLGPEPRATVDQTIVVAEGTPLGIVRAAQTIDRGTLDRPALVLNRVAREEAAEAVTATRRWTGLDPLAVVLDDPRIADRARRAEPAIRSLARALRRLEVA